MTYRVQNPSMRNSIITTNYGAFRFNTEGIINNVPYGLAQELLQLEGFKLIDDEGNEIELPETDPDNPNPDANPSVTLAGGEVWTTIPSGYTIQDSNTVYTLIGSAFDYNPPEVSLQSGKLVFGTGIDTDNVHAMGVTPGTTIQVGTSVFLWQDTDNNLDNGYELVLNTSGTDTQPTSQTLAGGGYYYQTENGYVVGDDNMTYTISGDFFDSDTISIDHGALVFSAGVDTSSIHVIGVESDATLQIGDVIYKWSDTDNNLDNGYELTPYVEPEPEPTLPAGWSTIDGGYVIEQDGSTFTLTGAFDTSDVSIEGSTFYFGTDVDPSSIHLMGVDSDTTAYVGSDTYVWQDTDNNLENGLELTPYVAPPEIHTLPGGSTWSTIDSGVVISDDVASYTLVGAQAVDSDTVALESGVLSFGRNIDTDAVHVLGVESGTTVAVGDDLFQWVEADNNAEDGLELIHYVPPTPELEIHTLPGGATYDTIDGGYVVSDTGTSYTLTGSAFDDGIEGVVDIQSGTFVFDSSVTTSDVHIQGIAPDTTLKVGDDTYIFKELDDNTDNGLEIEPYVPPVTTHTLPSGSTYETIDGGYIIDNTYTLTGTAFANGLDGLVDLQSGTFIFSNDMDTIDAHITGVNAGDTLYVGDTPFIWSDVDDNTENGLEIAEIPVAEPTLPAGWTALDDGFAYDDGITVVTVTGVELDDNNHLPVNIGEGGMIIFDESINPSDVHAIGVYTGDTLKIGEDSYQWVNTDNNPLNGLEVADLPTQVTLPAGWSTIDGGLVYTSDTTAVTISGVGLNDDNTLPVTIVGESIFFDPDVNAETVHIFGVNEDDTLMLGQDIYTVKDLDNNLENGLELTPYVAPPVVHTLPNGGSYTTVEGGFVVFDDSASYTLLGGAIDEENTAIQDGTLVFGTGIDTTTVHVLGVTADTSIQIGENSYVWKDTDNTAENGLELELVPTVSGGTLASGVIWDTIDGGYILTDNNLSYTLTGDAFNNGVEGVVDIVDGSFTFNPDVVTSDVHVYGVTADDSLYVGTDTFIWKDTDDNTNNGLEIAELPKPVVLPDGWSTIDNGLVYDDTITIVGASANSDGSIPLEIDGKTLIFDDSIDIKDIHAFGVDEDDTLQVGDEVYRWADTDNNLENGLEIAETIPSSSSPWSTIEGGWVYLSASSSFTIRSSVLGTGQKPIKTHIEDDNVVFEEGVDVSDIHVQGVQPNTTIAIGSNVYTWKDLDGDISNGYELELIPPPMELPEGWGTVEGGLTYVSDAVASTILGVGVDNNTIPVSYQDGGFIFSEGVDTDAIHAIGVNASDTVQVASTVYIWTDRDNNPDNGLELTAIVPPDTTSGGEDTVPPDTTPGGEDTIPPDTVPGGDATVNGFSYDFDGVAFTLTGGLNENVSVDDLNEKARIEKDGLEFGSGIISTLGGVHIQGLQSGTTVKVAGENYTLMDADGDLSNGYELVGGEADAYNWKRTNRSASIYEPQIWRHYLNDTATILVIGCSARPLYENNVLTVLGDDIKVISNESAPDFTIAGDVYGRLTNGVGYDSNVGLVNGENTISFVVANNTLYVPGSTVTGIGTEKFEFMLSGDMLTVLKGTIDVENAVVTGLGVASILYKGKKYYVNKTSGKLVRNAWQRQ